MNNNSYRNQYLQTFIERDDLNERSVQSYTSLWNCIAKAEAEIGKSLEEGYTREEYISLFSKMKIRSIFVLMPYKSHLGKYLRYLVEHGIIEQSSVDEMYSIKYENIEIDKQLEKKFFKDLDDLKQAIADALWAAERLDDRVFSMQISAIYLAWSGIQINDLVNIKKSDVHDKSITVGNLKIVPPPQVMEYVKDYRDATEYQSQAKYIITLKYYPSEMLFRTVKAPSVTPKSLRIYIRKLGKCGTSDDDNIFNYEKVYWSGIFYRAHVYESIHGPIENGEKKKMEDLFQERYPDNLVANKRLREYIRFKQYFYPEETANT